MQLHEIFVTLIAAGIITSSQLDLFEDAEAELRTNMARIQLIQVAKALRINKIQKNRLPSEEEFSGWLISRLEGFEDVKNDHDPWGTSLRYTRTEKGFRLASAGPDGSFGTEDDINYE